MDEKSEKTHVNVTIPVSVHLAKEVDVTVETKEELEEKLIQLSENYSAQLSMGRANLSLYHVVDTDVDNSLMFELNHDELEQLE